MDRTAASKIDWEKRDTPRGRRSSPQFSAGVMGLPAAIATTAKVLFNAFFFSFSSARYCPLIHFSSISEISTIFHFFIFFYYFLPWQIHSAPVYLRIHQFNLEVMEITDSLQRKQSQILHKSKWRQQELGFEQLCRGHKQTKHNNLEDSKRCLSPHCCYHTFSTSWSLGNKENHMSTAKCSSGEDI